ncbi:period circadian protein homolog 3-like [Spea bombifrons]|uniref:period circadian protein homolog 3-like n=1 Tax=Spea bombifrons TaxID=233779 RepID=UPI00234B9643|nr:period circadian protein homolog 3-like [Spea bombifrons]
MRNKQPWFTEEQKEELAEVHSWIRNRTIPQEIDTQGCVTCVNIAASNKETEEATESPAEIDTKADEQEQHQEQSRSSPSQGDYTNSET